MRLLKKKKKKEFFIVVNERKSSTKKPRSKGGVFKNLFVSAEETAHSLTKSQLLCRQYFNEYRRNIILPIFFIGLANQMFAGFDNREVLVLR